MANFILSAFADEYSPEFSGQLTGLKKFGIERLEIRGVDGKNVSALTPEEAKEYKRKLDEAGMKLSTVGSPLGKISLDGDINAHIELTRRVCEIANIMECGRIRAFSFYDTDGRRNEVLEDLDRLISVCESEGVLFCHENEKGIYGDTPEKCLDLKNAFGNRIGIVFDHANFIQCGCEPFPHAYEMLAPYITYMHIKDATETGTVVPAGEGIGRIAETFRELDKKDGDMILTLEPHLRVFKGLDELEKEGDKTQVKGTYETAEEAFAASVNALREAVAVARA